MTDDRTKTGMPGWVKSTGAIVAGFMVVVFLSTAGDAAMEALGVFPPAGQIMVDPGLYLLALLYRGAFTVVGGWVTARLAPSAPMRHVAALALVGLVAGLAGVVFAVTSDLGPLWYAVAVAVTGPLCTLLGGRLLKRAQP